MISKAGVVQMTEALALEWARFGIRVNALAPGYIATDINADFFETEHGQAMIKRIPMRRLGQPEDLDGAFLLLATDASRLDDRRDDSRSTAATSSRRCEERTPVVPGARGARARNPCIPTVKAMDSSFQPGRVYGFRARRCAPPGNDTAVSEP